MSTPVIKFKKLHELAALPRIGSEEAACVDVVATEVILDSGKATIKLGFSTEIPKGYKAVIVPRSSFTQKGWVMQNSPAQIDSDYRGEWMLKFQAVPKLVATVVGDKNEVKNRFAYLKFPYKVGDRVAQMYLEKVIPFVFDEVKELEVSARGEGGFGSTGI